MPFLALAAYLPIAKKVRREQIIIPLYLFITTGLMFITNYMADRYINNSYLYHLYSLIEVALFLQYIRQLTSKNWIFNIVFPTYTIFWLINLLFWEHYLEYNSNSSGVAAIVIIFFSLYYFMRLTQSDEIMTFQRSPAFWIVTGFLIYALPTIFVVITYKYPGLLSPAIEEITFDFRNVLNIIKFILITTGVLCSYNGKY